MKFLVAFVAIAAVALANPLKPAGDVNAEIAAIIAAIESPNTDPMTAILLEEQLAAIIAASNPISVGPEIIVPEISPIAIGPAIIDFPLPDGGVITAPVEPTPVIVAPIAPSPVVIGEIPAGQTPLVQIIVNVAGEESNLITPGGAVDVIEQPHVPGPVNIVDHVVPEPISPVQVVTPVVVSPVQVAEPVVVSPVQVAQPIVVSPVQVQEPIAVAPAVVLPEILN